MQAIQTYYSEHLFRSRLEARWAVFFNEIGLKWIYEMEGYALDNGQWYLPDFYFPELFCFGEVKPLEDIPEQELSKVIGIGKSQRIILLIGLPNNSPKQLFSPHLDEQDYYVQFHKDGAYWRFWWTSKEQDDSIDHFINAVRLSKQAQF